MKGEKISGGETNWSLFSPVSRETVWRKEQNAPLTGVVMWLQWAGFKGALHPIYIRKTFLLLASNPCRVFDFILRLSANTPTQSRCFSFHTGCLTNSTFIPTMSLKKILHKIFFYNPQSQQGTDFFQTMEHKMNTKAGIIITAYCCELVSVAVINVHIKTQNKCSAAL